MLPPLPPGLSPNRDRAAFAEFVALRSPSLQRAAYLLVGDVGLAQDLVQEALTKTYVAWPRLRRPEAAEAYARKAMTTTAISWFRRRSWAERPSRSEPASDRDADRGGGDPTDSLVERRLLLTALAQLPPRQRAVVVLRFYEDLTEAQTAEAMGCAIGTVKSQTSKALRRLKDLLGDRLPDDIDLRGSEGVLA